MQCGQGKPFKSYKMGGMVTKQSSIPSYQKGGMVKRPEPAASGVYTKEMGAPPQDVDMVSALKPAQRKAAEARMKAEQAKKK